MCGRAEERHRRIAELADAIARCEPDDACVILAGALDFLSAGAPSPGFRGLEIDAADWAEWAAPDELYYYGAAILERLARVPVRRAWRRNLARLAMRGLTDEDCRTAFLNRDDVAAGP